MATDANFDDLMEIDDLEGQKLAEPIKPLFSVAQGPDTAKWIKMAFPSLMKRNEAFFSEVKENLRLYKGNVIEAAKSSKNDRSLNENDPQLEKQRNAKLYINKIHDLVEFRVTTHNAAKPGIDIGPANVEHTDRIAAKVAKAVVDTVWYQEDEDEVERTALRNTFIAGEHYVGCLWDTEKGDMHPEYIKWRSEKKNKDAESFEYTDSKSGKPKKYDAKKPVRVGDVKYVHFPAWQVLPEPVDTYSKVTWLMTWETEYVEVAKRQFSKHSDDIMPLDLSTKVEGFDPEYLNRLRSEGKTIILTVFAKRCKYMPEGRYIKATVDGQILVDKELPYEHDELPLIRLTDLDMPGELRAKSFLRNIKGMQWQHYFLTSMVAANIRLMGYPKWAYELGSIQIKDFANARNVMGVRPGAQFPKIIQPNPTPPEVFQQIQDLDVQMDTKVKGAFSNPASIPKRVDSAAGLEYLDAKDNMRSHTMFSKVNRFRIQLTQQTIMVAGQFYDVTDKRLLKVVGKNHEYDIKHFDFANLNRPYDVRVRDGASMPEDPSQRREYILSTIERLPEGTFSPQQIIDLVDLGSIDKLVDIATKSLKAAESIIEDLLTGKPVPPPKGYEDLLTYWNTFATHIQDRGFKDVVPDADQQNVIEYLTAIEALMEAKAKENPAFAQLLMTLPLYPLVYKLTPVLPPEPPMDPNAMPPPPPGAAAPLEGDANGDGVISPEEEALMDQFINEEEVNLPADAAQAMALEE